MVHKFNDSNFSKLESEERKKILPSNNILKSIGLKEGDSVIDFGCGIGYFSIPASKMVGNSGKIIAIDESQVMIDEMIKRTENFNNVEVIKSSSIDENFKADVVLVITVFHEIHELKDFLLTCFKVLKDNGKLIIIDWDKVETKMGPPLNYRISKQEAIDIVGKDYVEYSIHEGLYFLEFKK